MYHWIVALLGHRAAAHRDNLIRCEAIRIRLAATISVNGGGEVKFGAVIQLERLHGSRFAGSVCAEEPCIRTAVESNGDGFGRARRAAVHQNRHWRLGRSTQSRLLVQVERNSFDTTGIAGPGLAILVEPGDVAVGGNEGARRAITQDRSDAGKHRPHIAAGVAAQVDDPALGILRRDIGQNAADIRGVKQQPVIVLCRAARKHDITKIPALRGDHMTFRQTAAGKGSRNGVIRPRTARCVTQGFFFRLLQQGDLIGIEAGRKAKMATWVA